MTASQQPCAANSIPSLDNDSSKSLSFTFAPDKFSDVTVHYRQASYHMHVYVLVNMSRYFEAVLSADIESEAEEACALSQRCLNKPSGTRCVDLKGDQIGGVDVTVDQLNSFFRQLYASLDNQGPWQQLIKADRKQNAWPSHYYLMKVCSTDAEKDEAVLESYEHDGIHPHVVSGLTVGLSGDQHKASSEPVGSWLHSVCMAEHFAYHLADYFQADRLMKTYETQADLVAKTSSSRSLDQCWRILQLTDRYNWPAARKICLQACAHDTQCQTREAWKQVSAKLKLATMTELFLLKQ